MQYTWKPIIPATVYPHHRPNLFYNYPTIACDEDNIKHICYCNGRGVCINDVCSCDQGFGGTDKYGFTDCSTTWIEEYPALFDLYRYFSITLSAIAIIYLLFNTLYYFRVIRKKLPPVTDPSVIKHHLAIKTTIGFISKIILTLVSIWISLDLVMWAADPMSYFNNFPYWLFRFIFDSGLPMSSICISMILEYILQTTFLTITRINQLDMFKKANSNYKGEVTLETILNERKKRTWIFWMSLIINVPFVWLQLASSVTHSMMMKEYIPISLALYSYGAIVCIIYSASIYFIWKRYIEIFPEALYPKKTVLPIFKKLLIMSIAILVNLILGVICWFLFGPYLGMLYYMLPLLMFKFTAVFACISIFDPPKPNDYLLIFGLIEVKIFGMKLRASKELVTSKRYTLPTVTERDSLSYYAEQDVTTTDRSNEDNSLGESEPASRLSPSIGSNPVDSDLKIEEIFVEESITVAQV